MKHVKVGSWKPSPEWLVKADVATTALRGMSLDERRRYVKSSAAAKLWGELREELLSLNHDKCWYTEAKIGAGDGQVEHFRPKLGNPPGTQHHEGYWWLSFDFANYRIAASIPNRVKSSDFPVLGQRATDEGDVLDDELPLLLDPTKRDDAALISFVESGVAVAANHATPQDALRVDYSLARLGLNTGTVVRERQTTWSQCVDAIRMWEMARIRAASSQSARTRAEAYAERIAELAAPDRAYSSTIRACISLHDGARTLV